MCGRTCLTLEPNEIQCACKYINSRNKNKTQNNDEIKSTSTDDKKGTTATTETDKKVKEESKDFDDKLMPEWRSEYNLGKKYQSSYNIAPSSITPVLVSNKHFSNSTEKQNESDHHNNEQTRLIVPMMWGMIPFWHKGDYRKHGLTTNNCRLEHMMESKLYRRPFNKGQRCVVICEGFYEWQTTKSAKPSERSAYFIHMTQNDNIKIYDKNTWKDKIDDIKLLKMAGLFDVWEDENGDKIYSYSVITYESNDTLSWLHHRMPAILETDEQVSDWLDFERVKDQEALKLLKMPLIKLQWYQISNIVNNVRNQNEECNKPLENLKKNGCSVSVLPKSKIMQSWLNVRKRKEDNLKNKLDAESDDELENIIKPKYSKLRGRSGSETQQTTTTTGTGTETETDPNILNLKTENIEIKKEI